jgi:uncharacterized protein (DUF342 family)
MDRPDGVYLKITGKINPTLLLHEIKRLQINPDPLKISQAAQSSFGEEVKILAKTVPATSDGVEITIASDKMEAYLTLNPAKGQKINPESVFRSLETAQVVYGVNIQKIKDICALGQSMVREPIAYGTPPVPGKDAEIHYVFEPPDAKPLLTEEGKVDYFELGQILLVKTGDVLACRIPPTPGQPGCNVLGEAVAAAPGKNRNFVVGKGVMVKGDTAVVGYEGALTWEGPKITVSNLYSVAGDVDFSQGNIKFTGKVLIKGYVREGFKVEADGDVEIRGGVEGAEVVSTKGSVYVRGGIIGQGKAIIKAAGNVEARFIQESTIEAGKNVVVNEYIIRSNIQANDSVLIQGVKGKILGENVINARVKIRANTIQAHKNLQLKVEGIDRRLCYQRIKDINESLELIDQEMRVLTVKSRLLSGHKDAQSLNDLKTSLSRYVEISEKSEYLIHERQELVALLKSTKGEGMIEIRGPVDSQLTFRIKNDSIKLPQAAKNVTLYYDQHEKRIVVLKS